jgi:hypothetical protein
MNDVKYNEYLFAKDHARNLTKHSRNAMAVMKGKGIQLVLPLVSAPGRIVLDVLHIWVYKDP